MMTICNIFDGILVCLALYCGFRTFRVQESLTGQAPWTNTPWQWPFLAAVVGALVLFIVPAMVTSHQHETKQAFSNLRQDHPEWVIRELSTSDNFASWRDGPQACQGDLENVAGRYVVLAKGVQCGLNAR